MKKRIAIVGSIFFMMASTVYASENVPEIDSSMKIEAGARAAVVSKNTKGQYWELVRKGMEAAVQDVNTAYGYQKDQAVVMTFEGPGDEQDVETQINTLDAVVAENPDVICIAAGDVDSCQAQLEAAKENGIPVVSFDSNLNDTELLCAYRGTDNECVGELAATKMAEAIQGDGKIAIFSAQEKTQSVQKRVEGFQNVLVEYPEIEIVEVIYSDQVEDMEAAMQQVLEENTDLEGVFCTNDVSTERYLDLEKDEENQPILIGVDATEKQQKAIEAGDELGCVSQNPYEIGYQTMLTALWAIDLEQREAIEKNVLLPAVWIDKNNINNEENAGYIYGK